MKRKAISAPLVVVALSAALAGCASTTQMDSMRADIQKAMDAANKASADAAAAKSSAGQAQATADEALATARAAKEKADQTEDKIDRMFKKAMYK